MKKQIILLENDSDDKFITSTILEDLNMPEIDFVSDSNELMLLLEKNELPNLLLIDFNSRPKNALTIIKELKQNSRFCHIPVVILIESKDAALIKKCYAAGAGSVIKKSDTYSSTKDKIENFLNYWIEVAEI